MIMLPDVELARNEFKRTSGLEFPFEELLGDAA